MRIAFTREPLFGHGAVHADCIAGLEATARLLESLGHHVEEAAPPLDRDACALAFATVIAGEARAEIEQIWRASRNASRSARDFEPATYILGLLGRPPARRHMSARCAALQLTARPMAPFFERYDVLLTPTLAAPPALIGALQPSGRRAAADAPRSMR